MNKNASHQYLKYLLRVLRHYFRSNEKYRIKKFKADFNHPPNLLAPHTFNEKILYRMINPDNEEFITRLVDKLKAREYVEAIMPGIAPEIYGTFACAEEIDISQFPEKFVLKCNHDSGSVVICTDKNNFDFASAAKKLSLHLKMNMYYISREWQYKNIAPRILCEEYIDRGTMHYSGLTPDVFRMHCFDGVPVYIEAEYTGDAQGSYTNIYDRDWCRLPVCLNGRQNTPAEVPKPERLDEALNIAKKLSAGLDYCRIDLYITATKIYFSEFTFSPNNGREKFCPAEWDGIFGAHWHLHKAHSIPDVPFQVRRLNNMT